MHKIASFIVITSITCSQAFANRYHEKIKHNNLPGLEALCRNKRSGINEKAKFGESPLHMAVVHNKPEMAQLLLTAGASILTTNDNGQTPLHSAAQRGFNAILSLLIQNLNLEEDAEDRTAILDWQDQDGNTALHLAAQAENANCIRRLVGAGADISIKNNQGLHAATIAQHLRDSYRGCDTKTKIRLSACHRFLQEKAHDQIALIGNPYGILADLNDLAIA